MTFLVGNPTDLWARGWVGATPLLLSTRLDFRGFLTDIIWGALNIKHCSASGDKLIHLREDA